MQESHLAQTTELHERIRNIEAEYRIVREELELERRGRNTDSGSLEKRLADYQRAESKFKEDISTLKSSKKQKLTELGKQYDHEKE